MHTETELRMPHTKRIREESRALIRLLLTSHGVQPSIIEDVIRHAERGDDAAYWIGYYTGRDVGLDAGIESINNREKSTYT